jgi:probable phosphoglycerate mutase
MTLYILRHGQTELNRLNIVQGSGMDSELNETGHAQSRAFYEAHRNIDFQLVVTSTLRRTHQTVQFFLDKNIPWHQTPLINEISWGVHEGKYQTIEQTERYRAMIAQWQAGNLDAAIPNGESARQLVERVKKFIDWVSGRAEQRILVATHGRTIRCLVAQMKGLPPAQMEEIEHSNTGLFVAKRHHDRWLFERENDTSHLELVW